MKSTRPLTLCQRGFSLIELMISLTLGLLLVAAMATLVANNSATRQEIEKSSRQIENGRYAMQLLSDDLRLAGFYGEFYNLDTVPSTLPSPCETDPANLGAALPLAIQGYDAPTALPSALATCLNSANWVSGTDILVVRRAATTKTAAGSLVEGRVYIQTRNSAYIIKDGEDASSFTLTKKDGSTQADIRQYLVHIYFLSPCSVPTGSTCTSSSDNGTPIPTLKRLELTDNGAGSRTMKLVPLVEGIETWAIDYGIDNYSTGAPDIYKTIPASMAEWGNVVTARVQLVARNNEPTAGYVDSKTYNMGSAGTYTPTATNYKRHAFSQLVRLVNPSARREQ